MSKIIERVKNMSLTECALVLIAVTILSVVFLGFVIPSLAHADRGRPTDDRRCERLGLSMGCQLPERSGSVNAPHPTKTPTPIPGTATSTPVPGTATTTPTRTPSPTPTSWSGFVPPVDWACPKKNYYFYEFQNWGDPNGDLVRFYQANGWGEFYAQGNTYTNDEWVSHIFVITPTIGVESSIFLRIDGGNWVRELSPVNVTNLWNFMDRGGTLVIETEFWGFGYDTYPNQLLEQLGSTIRRDETRWSVTQPPAYRLPSWPNDEDWFRIKSWDQIEGYAVTMASANLLGGPNVRGLYATHEGGYYLVVEENIGVNGGRIRVTGDTSNNSDDGYWYYANSHPDQLKHQAVLLSCTNHAGDPIPVPPTPTPSSTPTASSTPLPPTPSRTPTSTSTATATSSPTSTPVPPTNTPIPTPITQTLYLPIIMRNTCTPSFPYQVTPGIPRRPIAEPKEIFLDLSFCVQLPGAQTVWVAGDMTGQSQLLVDDVMTIYLDGAVWWTHDFAGLGGPTWQGPFEFTMPAGVHTVRVTFSDRYQVVVEASAVWLGFDPTP